MEFSTSDIVSHKWLFFLLLSFFGFIVLSSLNQGWLQGSAFVSLHGPTLEITTITGTISPSPESGESHMQLFPKKSSEVREAVKLVPSPQPSVDESQSSSAQTGTEIPSPSPQPSMIQAANPPAKSRGDTCNIFEGGWVYDPKRYPLYEARRCPFLSDQVSCRKNGRPDSFYEHWRWEPRGCEIPRFNGSQVLEALRGKRVAVIGDSLNRNQWESLVCILYSSTRPSRTTIKIRLDYKIFRALDYNLKVEFFWSPFLVPLLDAGKGQGKVLKLDKLPGSSKRWLGADFMVFNTGHWWTHRGSFKKWNYLENKGARVEAMKGYSAFETAMKTWARWVDRWVNPAKTIVFFRSISPKHIKESNNWCYNQTGPITDETYIQWFPSSMISIVERTIEEMMTPVRYLNITQLSEYRRDAHTAIYTVMKEKLLTVEERRKPESYADCNHWCLPGLPDTWNILMFASIFGIQSINQ